MSAALAAPEPDDDRPPVKRRYVLDGREVDVDQWCADETAKMRALTETEKAVLRVILTGGRSGGEAA